MNPGTFDRKVSFCTPVNTKTGMGAASKLFVHSFYAWANRVQVGSGNEQYINDRLVSPYNYKYQVHYKSGINETMRIIDNSVSYNILSITPDERKIFLDVFVEKVME
jgi:SPP1 family predicted phage head-tail adaptor